MDCYENFTWNLIAGAADLLYNPFRFPFMPAEETTWDGSGDFPD